MELRERQGGDARPRCIFCHGPTPVRHTRCGGCGISLHERCWRDLYRAGGLKRPSCPTLGCGCALERFESQDPALLMAELVADEEARRKGRKSARKRIRKRRAGELPELPTEREPGLRERLAGRLARDHIIVIAVFAAATLALLAVALIDPSSEFLLVASPVAAVATLVALMGLIDGADRDAAR